MDSKNQLLGLMDELSEEELNKILQVATQIKETNQRSLEEHAPVAFWDNDDKIWNEISR